MVRTVNEAAHTARRTAILDAAERMVATKGYEQMAIGDVLKELNISSGAFYHYFDSKPALLWALVERRGEQSADAVLPIVEDDTLGALDKFTQFFATLDRAKLAKKELLLAYMRVWYTDDNALFRHKLYGARLHRLVPLLEAIIRQGIAEGVFTTAYPDHTARHILALLEDFAHATADLLLSPALTDEELPRLQHSTRATTDALERLLGVAAGVLQPVVQEALGQWVAPTEAKIEIP